MVSSLTVTGSVAVWDVEELELVQAIVGVQPALPDDLPTGPVDDRALAASEHDEVVALS
jgi:hypothetical protein